MTLQKIDAKTTHDWMKAGKAVLIDVREPDEWIEWTFKPQTAGMHRVFLEYAAPHPSNIVIELSNATQESQATVVRPGAWRREVNDSQLRGAARRRSSRTSMALTFHRLSIGRIVRTASYWFVRRWMCPQWPTEPDTFHRQR